MSNWCFIFWCFIYLNRKWCVEMSNKRLKFDVSFIWIVSDVWKWAIDDYILILQLSEAWVMRDFERLMIIFWFFNHPKSYWCVEMSDWCFIFWSSFSDCSRVIWWFKINFSVASYKVTRDLPKTVGGLRRPTIILSCNL